MHIIPNLAIKPQFPIKINLPRWITANNFRAIYPILCLTGLIAAVLFYSAPHKEFPANTYINSIEVSGLTLSKAHEAIALAIRNYRTSWPITFTYRSINIPINLSDSAIHYDIEQALIEAKQSHQKFNLLTFLFERKHQNRYKLPSKLNPEWLASQSASIAQTINQPSIDPHIEVVKTASGPAIQISPGKDGLQFDQTKWEQQLSNDLSSLQMPDTAIPVLVITHAYSSDQINHAYSRAETLLNRSLTLKLDIQDEPSRTWKLSGSDLVHFVDIASNYDALVIRSYLEGLAQNINRQPKDAKFQFDESVGKVNEFVPAEKGIALDVDNTSKSILNTLDPLINDPNQNTVSVSIQTTEPSIQLSEVNRLGIKDRLGIGRSMYQHSTANRVHNVELAASRLNGTLVKPGDEFSYNAAIGEVSSETGYEQAYVIREGRTQLDDGGGVCQDSTTMFRAALDAGLPITMRKGHAYRVGYYEEDSKPGIDATVFAPSTDFRFKNDTPAYLLIQTEIDSSNRKLTFYIYGTSDGRKSTLIDHVIWDVTPALPDVYQDDPTLSVGVIKQVDWKAPGTKAKFTQHVERNGQVMFEKTFTTIYQPWANVFLRGTKQ